MKKWRTLLTTVLALLLVLTALPATGLTAKAAGEYFIRTRDAAGDEDAHKPVMYEKSPGAEVVYCLNYYFPAPGEEKPNTDGTGGYRDYIATNETIDGYVGGDEDSAPKLSGEDLRRKLIDILLSGYPNTATPSGLSDVQFRAATQYAIWYYTDGASAGGKYFVDQNGEEIPAVKQAYETLINAGTKKDEAYYAHHTLHIYKTEEVIKVTSTGIINGKEVPVRETKHYQNFAGVKTIVDDPNKTVEFSKTDVNGTEELPGAKLSVTGKDNKGFTVDETWVSTTETHKINLYPGEYTMTETTAPEGYEVAERIDFRITEDLQVEIKQADGSYVPQSESRVRMEDKRKTTTVAFSKTEVNGTSELPGATLKILDEAGKVVEEWVSTSEQRTFTLPFGTYTMVEEQAPDGYVVAESITFRITKELKVEIKEGETWVSAENATVHMEDAKKPAEEPKKDEPKKDDPKKDDPKKDEPKKDEPKKDEPKKDDTPSGTPENKSKPDDNVVTTPQVLGALRTEENVVATSPEAVLGARRSPETADPAPIALMIILALSSIVGCGTILMLWKKDSKEK